MSSATNNSEALAEFLADLQRLNQKPMDLINAVDQACSTMQENAQAQRRLIGEATADFLAKNQDAAEAHIAAKLAAKENERRLFSAKAPAALPADAKAK